MPEGPKNEENELDRVASQLEGRLKGLEPELQENQIEEPVPPAREIVVKALAAEDPELELSAGFVEGSIDASQLEELSRVVSSAKAGVLDAVELRSLLESGDISEETYNLLAGIFGEKLERPEKPIAARPERRVVKLEEEKGLEEKERLIQKASRLMRDERGRFREEEITEVKKEYEALGLGPEEEKQFRRELGTFILTQAQAKPGERLDINPALNTLEVVFHSDQAELNRSLYILYGALHMKENFQLSSGGRPPWATIANMARIRNRSALWLKEYEIKDPETRKKIFRAFDSLNKFFLRITGRFDIKRRIAIEKAIPHQAQLAGELREKFFARAEKEVAIRGLREEISATEYRAQTTLKRAAAIERSMYAYRLLEEVLHLKNVAENLKKQLKEMKKKGLPEEESPAIDDVYKRAMAILERANSLYDAAEEKRLLIEEKRRIAGKKRDPRMLAEFERAREEIQAQIKSLVEQGIKDEEEAELMLRGK